jgi:hypothetical protein
MLSRKYVLAFLLEVVDRESGVHYGNLQISLCILSFYGAHVHNIPWCIRYTDIYETFSHYECLIESLA